MGKTVYSGSSKMRVTLQDYFAMIRREVTISSGQRSIHPTSDDEMSVYDANHKGKTSVYSYKQGESPCTPQNRSVDSVQEKLPVGEDVAHKKQQAKYWPIIATGAGLFSDGYVNNTSSFIITIIETIYPASQYEKSDAIANLGAVTFVGTVFGMLIFGLICDYYSRKLGMLISTSILILFSIVAAGSWGPGMPDNCINMLKMLITMRAFLGVGIGGEYPAGSVSCAEVSQMLTKGSRNRWFIWFTNFMIDCGFVTSAFITWLLMYICKVPNYASVGNSHGLQAAWRILIGLGAIPPLSLLYLRLKFEDSDQFTNNNFRNQKTPWWLIAKRYGPRLCLVSLIWFIYDFMGYSYSTYSSLIVKSQVPKNQDGIQNIKTAFGWTVVFNLFYLPGSFLGGLASDFIGPRLTLFTGVGLQGVIGFVLAAKYNSFKNNIAPLVVVYGIFQTLGEFGSGDNIGLICSKTCASAVRARYYAVAAAIGKLGAFVGTYAFPSIAKHFGGIKSSHGQQVLVYISSSLCFLAALLVLFIPELSQESIAMEDMYFRKYLAENGVDPHILDDDTNSEADTHKTVAASPRI